KSVLETVAAVGIDVTARRRARVPVGVGFAGTIAAQRKPRVLVDVGPTNVVNPLLLEHGIRSMLGVPLLLGGELLGVLHVGSLTRRAFSEAEVEALRASAMTVA